ncbi:hypothetical protein F1728_04470 [Gimesia benthica]|uniref:Uncharacterized protein n=1 Tax=Gimesia benthica TaxID=2608982 RepID=A0A6I6AAC3_9PLAN|nr:hypothetical protein [Gimesia benthica]QGQ21991.1 hypothetical protein F1728_04470 [Gimesia benthica]
MPLWDNECDVLVNQELSINGTFRKTPLQYKHQETLNRMNDNNLPDGVRLIKALYARMVENWELGGSPQNTSDENWRFTQCLVLGKNNYTHEVTLERTMITVLNNENWVNQIPVDSGLLENSNRSVDLAYREGNTIQLIELKVDSNTPLSAAIQILKYGLTNAFFRTHSEELETQNLQTPLLSADEIQLRVLAPAAYYNRFDEQTEWLRNFGNRINDGLAEFSAKQLMDSGMNLTTFQFEVFPDNFQWDPTRQADDEHRNEVLTAVNGRRPL